MSGLKQHKEAKHEGIRYPCDECEYITAYAAELKRHKKSKHDNREYTAMQTGNIEVHHQKVMDQKLSVSKYQGYWQCPKKEAWIG